MPTNVNDLETRTNRWMIAGLVLMLIGLLAFPVYRIYEPIARAEAADEMQNNLALAGESLWSSTCASCHGSFGQGVDAPALYSEQFLTIATDAQILSIASTGIPGSDMAAYGQQYGGPLTQEQLVAVVACIRSWEETAPDRPDWRDIPAPEEAGDGHDHGETPTADDHDEVGPAEGPPACGPNFDPALFDDHDEEPAVDDHDEEPAVDDHDEETADHDH